MREVKTLTDNKFLNIKQVCDTDMHVKAYQFAERKGIDSIAFICCYIDPDNDKISYLLNWECTPPTGEMLLRAFGGSLDKEKELIDIVIDEVKEEAGYKVTDSQIYSLGPVFVSTQMNQYCHLFLVDVFEHMKVDREPENATEATSEPKWMTEEEVIRGSDWKAITIITKAKYDGILKP